MMFPPNAETLKAKILVCNGAADPFVPQEQIDQFTSALDSIGANYQYIAYDSAVHAFTSKAADEMGQKFNLPLAYDEAADNASWSELLGLLESVFWQR